MEVALGSAKEIHLVATIIRADGSKEELGTIDYWHKNPFKRLYWKFKKWLLS